MSELLKGDSAAFQGIAADSKVPNMNELTAPGSKLESRSASAGDLDVQVAGSHLPMIEVLAMA